MTQTKTMSISVPKLMLHVEGITLLVSAVLLYANVIGDWGVFVVLLFAPDLTFVGYLVNKAFGSLLYNLFHTYTLALILIGIGVVAGWQLGIALGLINLAHIGLDRMLGYGLKYPSDFKNTHLQRL